MPLDTSSLPISGGGLLALALYAGASLWAGQLVGQREIERSGWVEACDAGLRAELADQLASRSARPDARCSSVIGRWHPDLARLCQQVGNPDLAGAARRAEQHARELENRRLSRAAAGARGRCQCAKDVYLQERLIALGLYAGSARLVSLAPVSGMEGELRRNLSGPYCSGGAS
ncbi:hypothetical protein [Paracoccus isoporae]|uniref:hypothetical protein n=1 Tax=Paracoccus isoporae TaxID=591205 RepID=UPI00115FBC2F|nr:hypothetical protein [Paracoccus isoporae]